MKKTQGDLCYLSIREASRLIESRKLSPVELTRACLERIQALDGQLKSFVTLLADSALQEARAAEAEIMGGRYRGPFHGIPVAHKDQYDTKGVPTASRLKSSGRSTPSEDATAVRKLREAGSVLLGKLAMGGMALGAEHAAERDQARNPWNLDHMPGGSSSGSGASVAAGLCMGSLGEDTGGSIRTPAAMCGIVGLKPTHGRISRYGLAPLSWSLDTSGPLTRTVEDTALMLQTIAGYDPRDPASSEQPVADYSAALREDLRGLTVGFPRQEVLDPRLGVEPAILAAVEKALAVLEGLGARVEEVRLQNLEYSNVATTVIWYSEGYAFRRADLEQRPEIFGERLRTRLYLGSLFTSGDYVQAQRVRLRVQREFADIFRKADVLVMPTLPKPAPASKEFDPLAGPFREANPNFQAVFNLAGLPAISVPCGFTTRGLPIGLQIAGKPFEEATVLMAAYAYQQHAGWHRRRPPI